MGKGDSRPPHTPGQSAANKPSASEPAASTPAGPVPAQLPQSAATPPATSRTTTLDDPLTTSLLAEIARRPSTAEMSPAQLARLRAAVPGAVEPEHRGDRDPADRDPGDRDPDDPA